MKFKILAMLEMQDNMNSKVHLDWINQKFDWYRAIWIESAELMDHHGWKWWKQQNCDTEQVKLELIDIWHFGLSIIIINQGISDETASNIADQLTAGLENNDQSLDLLQKVEMFAAHTLTHRDFSIELFAALIDHSQISINDLYRSYVGKNVLNFFRQDHGYQDGTYIKVWSGQEDNEHLVEILSKLDTESPSFKDDIYQQLLSRYRDFAV